MANNKKYISLSRLSTFLDNLKNTFAPQSHKHTVADLTDYTVDTELSSTSANPVANKVIDAEFEAISQAMGALDLSIDGKADASHSHNDLYYTETEIDQKLSEKANASHSHAISEVTNLQSTLDAKVPTSRTVNGKDLTTNITLSASDVGASPASHDHNSLYYTQTQIDTKLQSKSDTTHNHDDKYDTKSSVNTKIDTHNASTTAHNDIRLLISGLTTRLNTLANSDDTTLDQLSEIVAYIKNNKSLIEDITTSKVNVSDIIDNLTTNVTNKPLSAAQGVTINGLISDLQEELNNIPQSDWNQNDSTKLDHIKNRPFYTTNPVETIILNGTISTSGRLQSPTSIDSLTLGDMYTVVFDDVTYNNLLCADSEGLPAIGSIDFSFTDYPFAFGVQSGTAMAFVGNNSTSHSIKVIAYLPSIVPLERKYIAEHIDKFAGEKVDGKVYTVDGSQVTAGVGAEVFNDYNTNIASGRYSHAEGMNNTASGMLSHAEGWSTKASGSYSHTEGQETTASEDCAHAEGWLSEATNTAAHAEGFATNATGLYSHAEGDNATASGKGAHAEGYLTDAIGNYSHAEGSNTNASSDNQHVQGKYNVVDAAGKYAHIVGNGTSNSNRVNIHTLDWNGNGWFKGDIYVGGASMDDTSASKLVKESDAKWTLIYDSGEIPDIANSIAGINVSGYTNFEVLIRCYNDGDSHTTRTGSAIFTAQNGKSYQFPVWTNMFSKSISTVHAMAQFKLVDGWLVCPCASSVTSSSVDIFDSPEGGTAGNLVPTGSGMMKCTSPLSTLTISNLDQNSDYYFGTGSRVMVWGWKA